MQSLVVSQLTTHVPASTAKKVMWVHWCWGRPSERGPVPGSNGLPVKGDVSMSRGAGRVVMPMGESPVGLHLFAGDSPR